MLLRLGLAIMLLAVVGGLVAACGGDDDNGEQTAAGIILNVEASSITEVESFTFRTDDGETLEFRIAPEASRGGEEGFVASHLRSHSIGVEHTVVHYRVEGDELLAISLEHD